MKKVGISKANSLKKGNNKGNDTSELKKATKLKPLKEKEKKSWMHSLNDEDDDFNIDDELNLETDFEEEEDENYSEDEY